MEKNRKRLARLTLAAAALVALGAAPSFAQSEAVPCNAFARTQAGGWRVLAPVMLDLNGRIYGPMVGTVFPAGASQHGIEMSDVLDQQCGNR
jgi:hypothetical protein